MMNQQIIEHTDQTTEHTDQSIKQTDQTTEQTNQFITPQLNTYDELCKYVKWYKKSSLYELRETNGLIFDFELHKCLLSVPPQYKVYYKFQSEKTYKQINLLFSQIEEFINLHGIETTDKLLLKQYLNSIPSNIKQKQINIFV